MTERTIISIGAQQTLQIRQTVLWPGQLQEFSKVEGDEDAQHFGVILDKELVSVASIFPDSDNTARLRKFATLPNLQGQGIGSDLLKHIMEQLRSDGFSMLWCDGREQARSFYERQGFEASGERFFKKDIAYFRMVKLL